MSKYTTEVRFICETAAGLVDSQGYNSIDTILSEARESVFDFDYPIFDENYRETLEKKILKHYYTREICEETVGLWKLRLDDKMNLIMPYYNQLYKSELIKFNPMYNVQLSRTHTGKKDNIEDLSGESINSSVGVKNRDTQENVAKSNDTVNSKTNVGNESVVNTDKSVSQSTAEKIDKYSDTPQGAITDLADDTYLTNARIIDDKGNSIGVNNGSRDTQQQTNGTEIGKENSNVSSTIGDTIKDNRNDINKTNAKNKISGTDAYLESVMGKDGGVSMSKMLMEFRKTFLNIDEMVIEELSDLFFGLW